MSKSILVVDDNQIVLRIFECSLQPLGYNVELVTSAQGALNSIQLKIPDLIFADINMPGMDGITMIEEIRKVQGAAGIPIIMCTTESQIAVKQNARKVGANGWIQKPFDSDKILKMVQEVLDN